MALSELVMIGLAVGAVGTLGVVIVPGMIRAQGDEQAFVPSVPGDAGRLEMYAALRELFASSRLLLGSWGGADGRGTEALLWYEDANANTTIDESELVLIAHSAVMETVTAFVHDDLDASGPAVPVDIASGVDGSLARRWVSREEVSGHVVAGGVTSMRVERVGETAGFATVRVHLTWEGASADAPGEEASFEVELAVVQGIG